MFQFRSCSLRRILMFLLLCSVALGASSADATHYRGGTMSWERDLTHPNPSEAKIIVTIDTYWTWSWSGWSPQYPNVGAIPQPFYGFNVVLNNGVTTFYNLASQVVAVNAAEDWFVARFVVTLGPYTIATQMPATIGFQSGDRGTDLAEGNHDLAFGLTTIVDPTKANRSPKYTGSPRFFLLQEESNAVALPTVAYSGLSNFTTIAPKSESLLFQARPMGTPACVAGCAACDTPPPWAGGCALGSSVSSGGVLSWTPQLAGEYAVQFKVTSIDSNAIAKAAIPVDVLLVVLPTCAACRPVVTAAPTVSVAGGSQSLSLPVNVTQGSGGSPSTLAATGLPAGATLTPTTGLDFQATLQWTPAASDAGDHVVCFRATADDGYPSTSACTTITVTLPCAPGSSSATGAMPCTPCAAGTYAANAGATTCATCTASCGSGSFATAACTTTQDTTCGACHAACSACSGGTATDCTSCPSGDAPVAGACLAGCSPLPATGCRLPALGGKSQLNIKDDTTDTKDALKWKWAKGSATAVVDFGDPVTATNYFLCVYDAGTLVSTSTLPAGGLCAEKPCWTAKKTGFAYKDKERSPDGVFSAQLKAGASEKASIVLGAKGELLETPTPSNLTGPLRVQLQRSDGGLCFESTFSAPFKKNKDGIFVALGD